MGENGKARPRAVLVWRDHWSCAMFRAELLERGWESGCARSLGIALLRLRGEAHPRPIDVVLVDQATLSERERSAMGALIALKGQAEFVLLGRRVAQPQVAPWDYVVDRPISIGALADLVASSAFRPRKSADRDHFELTRFTVRLGAPWPSIWCKRCGLSRHHQAPRSEEERERVRVYLMNFVLEHASCRIRSRAHAPTQPSSRV